MLKKLLTLLITLLVITSCGITTQVPIETIYNYKDSTIVHNIDSIVITPIYEVKDIVAEYDTLKLETDLAKSISYVDTTTHTLKGTIKNKKEQQIKYVYRDRIQYKDSVQIKEVPVNVEVEKKVKIHPWYETILWIFSVIGLVSILILALKIYLKFYGKK